MLCSCLLSAVQRTRERPVPFLSHTFWTLLRTLHLEETFCWSAALAPPKQRTIERCWEETWHGLTVQVCGRELSTWQCRPGGSHWRSLLLSVCLWTRVHCGGHTDLLFKGLFFILHPLVRVILQISFSKDPQSDHLHHHASHLQAINWQSF